MNAKILNALPYMRVRFGINKIILVKSTTCQWCHFVIGVRWHAPLKPGFFPFILGSSQSNNYRKDEAIYFYRNGWNLQYVDEIPLFIQKNVHPSKVDRYFPKFGNKWAISSTKNTKIFCQIFRPIEKSLFFSKTILLPLALRIWWFWFQFQRILPNQTFT